MVKVFGHISPDTDATGSAILWAWYLNAHTTFDAVPYVLGSLNKETAFVLNCWEIPEPALLEAVSPKEDVVIVDTNNPQELFSNILETSILQIIDHHRLVGGLSTSSPIEVTLKPHASTATVIFDLLGSHAETMPENMMGIMLSCILSDTLEFRSPTTTPHDKNVAEMLAKKLGIEISEHATEMFDAKSDVSDFTDAGLVHLDSKKTEIGSKNFRVSVVETTNPQLVLDRKDSLITAIKDIVASESDVDDVLFFVVDILKEEATVFTYNELIKDIIALSFGVSREGDTQVLPGIVSRKKQIIPMLKLPE